MLFLFFKNGKTFCSTGFQVKTTADTDFPNSTQRTQLGQKQRQQLTAECSLQLEGKFVHDSLTPLSLTQTSLQSKVSSFRTENSQSRLLQSQLPNS